MEKRVIRISIIVFLFSISIILVNLVSLIFPALLVTSVAGSESRVNSLEPGAWTVPLLLVNFAILIFGLLYYRQALPEKITKLFKFILSFEVSRKIAFQSFLIIIGIYIIFSIGELAQNEGDVWKDWEILKPIIEDFPNDSEQPGLSLLYVKNFFLYLSQEIFGNVKIIPFIGSIALVFLTYLLTVKISGKRFAGLVAIVILLQSHTFLRYDTSATYSNFWVLFYLISLYLVYKKWYLSPVAYLASIFSKTLTIVFFPMTLFFIYRSKISKKTKIISTIPYLIIFAGIAWMILFGEGLGYEKSLTSFEFIDFVTGFTAWAFQLRIDGLVLIFLFPLAIGLFLKSKQGFREADSILILLAGILLSAPLLAGLTNFSIEPYRWMPLVTFFAIGVGLLFSKVSDSRSEN